MQNMNVSDLNKYLHVPDFSSVKKGGTSLAALNAPNNIQNNPNMWSRDNTNINMNPANTQYITQIQNTRNSENLHQQNRHNDQRATEYSYGDETEESKINMKKIDHLVSDINKSLEGFSPSRSLVSEDSEEEDDNEKTTSYWSYIPNLLKEPLLLLIIYVILSQNFVYNLASNYITYLNPKDDGRVPLLGVIIYGAILAIIFMFFKKILI